MSAIQLTGAQVYEALAGKPGMESLRVKCPNIRGEMSKFHGTWCGLCQGRGWLPLPEAERMGALVRLWLELEPILSQLILTRVTDGYEVDLSRGPTPESALTKALLTATEQHG